MENYQEILKDLESINLNQDSIKANMKALNDWAKDSGITLDTSKGFSHNAKVIADKLSEKNDDENLNSFMGYLKTLIRFSH